MNQNSLEGKQENNLSPLLIEIFLKNNEQAIEDPSTVIGIWRKNKYIFTVLEPKYYVQLVITN